MRRKPASIPWPGTVYRASAYDVPLWVNPNRRHGRWNVAGEGCTQYFCLDSEGPYAELLRGEDLRTEAAVRMLELTLWQLRIEEGAIVDYGSFEKAEAAGFPPEALVDDDHERCRAEAARLRDLGATGLLTPSAALPGTTNLTVFGPRVPVAWGSPITLASMVPHQPLSHGSAPPALVKRVRFYGAPHADLVRFRAAQKRLF